MDPASSEAAEEKWVWPTVAKLCMVMAAVEAVAISSVLYFVGVGPRFDVADPLEVRHFHNAKGMLVPAFCLEVCYLISASTGYGKVHLHGYHMSLLVIIEYMLKMGAYTTMAYLDGGLMHTNWRAGERPTYTVRFMDWIIALPLLLIINNYPFIGDMSPKQFLWRMAPNLCATASYVLGAWVAQVSTSGTAAWALIALTLVTHIITNVDQCIFISELKGSVAQYRFKLAVVVFKDCVTTAYGSVYVLGCMKVLTSLQEQVFYTYGDVVLKVVQAACLVIIRNWEDLNQIQEAYEIKVSRGKEDMSRLIRKANALILSMDCNGKITGWNEHLARISQISEQEAIGRDFQDLVQAECRDAVLAALDSCRKGLSTGAVELTLHPVDARTPGSDDPVDSMEFSTDRGSSQPVQMLVSFVMQLGGDISSIVAIGQDLTELVAQKALEERKSRFAAVVSHELRSPLHGIMGLSGAMAEAASDTVQKKQLAMIQGCANRLLDLVTNIMEMSQCDSKKGANGNKEADRPNNPVNIMDIVDEVIGMTRAAVDKAGKPLLRLEVKLLSNMSAGNLPMVRGDAYKCTQLLYNLVTNACKFTKKGSVTIAARHDKENGMIELDVADTGAGIAPHALKRIFEPFEQEDNKDSRNFQGVGLGLSVALGIAKLHRGDILVKSTVGKGSTFTVRLPCDEELTAGYKTQSRGELQDMQEEMEDDSEAGWSPEDKGKPLILSVDDDEINQEVVERTLGDTYRVHRVMNGMDALAYLKKVKTLPNVVLLDVMMPGLSGWEVVKEIRCKLGHGHLALPVLMLSARSPHEETAMESFKNGATDYMQKPFSATMLRMRLAVVTELKQELDALDVKGRGAGAPNTEGEETALAQLRLRLQAAEEQCASEAATANARKAELEQARVALEGERERGQAVEARLTEVLSVGATGGVVVRQFAAERDEVAAELDAERRAAVRDREALRRAAEERLALEARAHQLEQALAEERDAFRRAIEDTREAAGAYALPAERAFPPDGMQLSSVMSEFVVPPGINEPFLRQEIGIRDRQLAGLRETLDRNKAEAWLHKHRAEAAVRENLHLRGQLRNLRWCGSLSMPMVAAFDQLSSAATEEDEPPGGS